MQKTNIALTSLAFVLCSGMLSAQGSPKKKPTHKPAVTTVRKDTARKKDEDIPAVGGTGAPIGYEGRTDNADQFLYDAKYVRAGNGWDVTTGPAHILFQPGHEAAGSYSVSATFEQLEKPRHPEAYGLFIGGKELKGANQRYLYFLVRGTGEMIAKVRRGNNTTNAIAWRANSLIPKEDAAGKATYKLAIQVTTDSVKFSVNGHEVGSLAKGGLPTDGIYGLRINHNLHVHVTPVSFTRP